LLLVSLMAASTAAQEPVASTRDVLRIIARVERVDSLGRTLTLRAENGHIHTVYVDQQLALFDELKSGEDVSKRAVARHVVDRRLLEGLKRGDVVEVTCTRARAIELERWR
jgi:hypothetical protein